MAYKKSESARGNFGKFIHHFQSETKTLIRKFERILIKWYRQNVSLLFNQIRLNEWLLPNSVCVCVCVCARAEPCSLILNNVAIREFVLKIYIFIFKYFIQIISISDMLFPELLLVFFHTFPYSNIVL